MPPVTPTRALVLLTSFLLVSFLWTWGLPHQSAAPTLPILNHDAPQEKPVVEQLVPEPLVENPGGEEGIRHEKATPTTLVTEIVPDPTRSPSTAAIGPDTSCKDVRGASDLMVIVRTSKAEMDGKLPTSLETLLSCVPNLLIFSDHDGKVDGYTVYDALAGIANTTKSKHEEFLEYDNMQTDKTYNPNADKVKALDKWKVLPMVYKTAIMAPGHRFYMFIEADTSMSWTNLLQWLDRLDYRIPYYSGVSIDDKRYAQSGPGIMLSYGALEQYRTAYEERYATEWESQVASECCGDLVLATAMKQSRVEFYSSLGLLEAGAPSTLEWTQKTWCTPIVSWYRLTSKETDVFWDIQKAWTKKHGWATPYVHFNAFEQFINPILVEQEEDWDNISSDTQLKTEQGRRDKLAKQKAEQEAKKKSPERPKTETKNVLAANSAPSGNLPKREESLNSILQSAADNPSNCRVACQMTDDCLQWKHTTKGDGECHLGKTLRLGAKVTNPKADAHWTSGWILERVTKVTQDWGKCEMPEWKFNQ